MKNITTIALLLFLFISNSTAGKELDKELNIVYPQYDEKVAFNQNEPFIFIWTDSLKDHVPYSFRIVEILKGQKPEEALEKNKPLFEVPEINDYYYYYPWQAPGLQNGKSYAWQILSRKDGISRYSTFSIHTELIPYHKPAFRYNNQFADVKEELDGSYQMAFDRWLWIHYEELYETVPEQGLRFRILDKRRNLLVQTDEAGNSLYDNTPLHPIARKENWLKLNLTSLNVNEEDYYYLEVWNEKGETHFLRFRFGRSRPLYYLEAIPYLPEEQE